MYPFELPHTITNPMGEQLTFEAIEIEDGQRKMLVTNRVAPKAGPPFHVHFKQDECLVVVEGKMGYQVEGEREQFAEQGDEITFKRGQMHRFWNAGEDTLVCKGWIKPANSIDYFLSGIYASMAKAGKPEGDPFDSAFLMTRYRSEYDLAVIPSFVKKVVMPATVLVGRLLGKYDHFKDAPPALK